MLRAALAVVPSGRADIPSSRRVGAAPRLLWAAPRPVRFSLVGRSPDLDSRNDNHRVAVRPAAVSCWSTAIYVSDPSTRAALASATLPH
jgi:hypothetical protein